ncbi:hypothetical protein PINS_up024397 [Pythium insidiosum]|nr:hypothetical protein PINS_up024397 [Pythium insidiosum]
MLVRSVVLKSKLAMSTTATPDNLVRLSERERFYRFCKAHIAARDNGGYITSQASRLLLKYVKACLAKLPVDERDLEEVTRKAIDRCPVHRIDLDALERFEIVMRSTEYAVSATGDEFAYSKLLQEALIDGVPMIRVAWEPTWEPVANVPKSALKKYRDKKRDARAMRGRSAAIVAQARKAGSRSKAKAAGKRINNAQPRLSAPA